MGVLSSSTNTFGDKKAIAEAFGRAAQTYDTHAELQRDVGQRLMAKLPADMRGMRVLDLGCGTGYFSLQLLNRGATVVCADLSTHMLHRAQLRCTSPRASFIQVDAESLPFSDGDFDVVFSSLALQWCRDLSVPLCQAHRVTKPGGLIVFSTLLDGTLSELEAAWSQVDQRQHINQFITYNQVKVALAQASCTHNALDLPTIVMWYSSALAVMRDLKGIGATHVAGRGQGLTSRQTLRQVESAYQEFRSQEGLLPATYQVCLGVIQHD
ncbi:malonyl-ACP O-methyltransferase BioC [Vibrio sp. WXL103]|uniref:malonyl-ACP O-methyltransferase BioC n=1 Tax=unclassified Vibrio TaxID=2614977 RepID=UPI003EC8FD11